MARCVMQGLRRVTGSCGVSADEMEGWFLLDKCRLFAFVGIIYYECGQ